MISGHNIFAVTLWTIFEHIVKALTHEIRPFLILVSVFVKNKFAKAEMPWLQNLPMDIFTKLSVESREMSNIGTMFNLV